MSLPMCGLRFPLETPKYSLERIQFPEGYTSVKLGRTFNIWHSTGATENAGVEKAGASKMQGWKSRDFEINSSVKVALEFVESEICAVNFHQVAPLCMMNSHYAFALCSRQMYSE